MAEGQIIEGVSETGLTLKDYNTLLEELQTNLNAIYAADGDLINFDSETPDGQFTNIVTQLGSDVREVAKEVYNSFDPAKCQGSVQDSRYALNYLTRNGGTYTIQNINVTVDKTVTLTGLDSNYNESNAASYTVSDDAGYLWYLIDTVEITAGTHSLPFRAQNIGYVVPTIGTITNQVTKVIGVTSVINSIAPTTLGSEQETDSQFKIRRERSTALKSQNNVDAMLGQLLELDGVSDAATWINNTNSTDATGTPANTLWVIVDGGANTDIANTIYQNSCGMATRGAVEVDVTAVSGQIFHTKFDRATPVPLYVKFDFKLTVKQDATDTTGITSDMVSNTHYGLNENAETSKLTEIASNAITANGGGGYALNLEISTDGSNWTDFIESPSLASKFVIDSTRIFINVIEV